MAKRCVLSSARVLTEGVGIPEVDAAVFADPRKSIVDTVQTVGRALRQSPQHETRGISHSPGSRLGAVVGAAVGGKTGGRRRDTAVMAVTQQLARISAEYLASCRRSADASPDGDPLWDPPSAHVLDLDWAPFLLERVCELGGLDNVHRTALRQALNGDTAIDLAFLNTHPHAIGPFGPAPTALSAAQVARTSELLGQIDFPALLAVLPPDETEAASLIGNGADKIIGGPKKYMQEHFNAMREFYRGASRRQSLVVLWWA